MGANPRTRREVLAAGLAGGAGLLLAACGAPTAKRAAAVKPAGSDIGAIDHVIFLMQENRSFDHYFGSYRGVRGFDDHPAGSLGVFAQSWPAGRSPTLLPFHFDTASADGECTYDLSHAWSAQHESWNKGTMDNFVATHTSTAYEGPSLGVNTMGYYTRADLSFHYALADAFTICDGYHCSVLGPTHPNRLYHTTGTIDPDGRAGGPVIITNEKSEAIFSVSWETMAERLQASGVSWKVYNPSGPEYQPGSGSALLFSTNMMLYFKQFSNPSSEIYKRAFGPIFPGDFAADVAAGTLPAVSWIIPPVGFDEHPPSPPALGEWFTHSVLSTLVSNPAVWAKTVLFVTYDENDGFFDHVPPPTPPAGTAGEYLGVLPAAADGIAGPIGLGVRVPLLVLSPFSRGGYVCSDTFDHTSQLRFLEERFGVEVPNLSAWRRSVAGDLTSTLLASADASVPALPVTPRYPRSVTNECSVAELVEVDIPATPYPVPSPQVMPTQEPGLARRVKQV
jgi:phospholipase C